MLSGAFFKGMAMGGGLIVAIGAQNAFLLRQALQRRYVTIYPHLHLLRCTADCAWRRQHRSRHRFEPNISGRRARRRRIVPHRIRPARGNQAMAASALQLAQWQRPCCGSPVWGSVRAGWPRYFPDLLHGGCSMH